MGVEWEKVSEDSDYETTTRPLESIAGKEAG